MHGVNLAMATGQVQLIDQELCAILLATMHGRGVDAYRVPGVFGPEVVAPAAMPHEQLAAFPGRDLQRVSAGVAS